MAVVNEGINKVYKIMILESNRGCAKDLLIKIYIYVIVKLSMLMNVTHTL